MPRLLILPLLLASAAALATPPRPAELFLAGGALRTCSDLAPQACRTLRNDPDRRMPARYRVDREVIAIALDPLLWRAEPGAPTRAELSAMLDSALREADLSRDELEDHFAAFCPQATCSDAPAEAETTAPGLRDGDGTRRAPPWQRLLDDEQAALLSALELPQLRDGRRLQERAYLDDSVQQDGVNVLRAFVAAAAVRANGQRPRIAVVTASAVDPFDPVDFYLDAFRQLGADVTWWPVDAALQSAVFDGEGCDSLETLRRRHLQLPGRDRVYPDLADLQRQACLDPAATAALPGKMQGMFFAGGDQWRHRRAFFDRDDQPNAWLQSLRAAHARGDLVVGGTSAGTAVQGGAAMLSNGSSEQALRTGALAREPMALGCSRAGRCTSGDHEDSLTYWPAGGLGLLPGWTVDTHFSERARELRLLMLMHAASVGYALGVDETSAIHVTRRGDALSFEALGAQGGWLFERPRRDGGDAIVARVHYLAPGAVFVLGANGLPAPAAAAKAPAVKPGQGPADALEPAALRSAARAIAACDGPPRVLAAGAGRATLDCTRHTFSWRPTAPGSADADATGVGNLLLRYAPGEARERQ